MRSLRLALGTLMLGSLASLAPACTPYPAAGDASGVAPGEKLPAYKGELADQFDDGIDPHAVGLELDTYAPPRSDKHLRARALSADVAVRGRVTTVTGQIESGSRIYQLSLHTVERLAGKHAAMVGGDDFTVRVDNSSPSLGIVKSMEGQLVGKSLVVFVKAFAPRGDGDRDLHFHAMIDAPDVVAAVKEAVVLDEVK